MLSGCPPIKLSALIILEVPLYRRGKSKSAIFEVELTLVHIADQFPCVISKYTARLLSGDSNKSSHKWRRYILQQCKILFLLKAITPACFIGTCFVHSYAEIVVCAPEVRTANPKGFCWDLRTLANSRTTRARLMAHMWKPSVWVRRPSIPFAHQMRSFT